MKTVTPRQQQALDLRAAGLTYREIGERLGISSGHAALETRVGQYRLDFWSGKGRTLPDFLDWQPELCARTVNCLRNGGIVTAEAVLAAEDPPLLRIPNFGRKSLAEVHALQQRLREELEP